MGIDLYSALVRSDRAVEVAIDYLRRRGVDWSAHPTAEDAQREYDRIWSVLGSRTIEELIEPPPMTDAGSLAMLDVLTRVGPAALFNDANFTALAICRAINLSLEHGHGEPSSVAYGWLGNIAGHQFGDYKAAFRVGQLGYELVERRGLKRFHPRPTRSSDAACFPSRSTFALDPISCAEPSRSPTKSAISIGRCTARTCSSRISLPREMRSPTCSATVRDRPSVCAVAPFGAIADINAGNLQFIRTLRGLTHTFGRFDDGLFDEREFERHLSSDPELAVAACWYFIRKLQARFLAGDPATAIEAAAKAQAHPLDDANDCHRGPRFFLRTVSRRFLRCASREERGQHLLAMTSYRRQLEIWAENCPENFENRSALVGAEIARIENRDLDAMRLYEKAIHSSRTNGFVNNEALAYERASDFYRARGFDKIADTYLRKAQACYASWGADGKSKATRPPVPRP